MTDFDVLRATFGSLAVEFEYFKLALGFGLCVSLLSTMKRAGWL